MPLVNAGTWIFSNHGHRSFLRGVLWTMEKLNIDDFVCVRPNFTESMRIRNISVSSG